MCKLLIMTGITEGLVAQEFMRRMAIPMSKSNPHGIGYSAVAGDGKLFSERWINNDQFFDTSNVMTPRIAKLLAAYEARLPKGALESNYSRLGKVNFDDVRTVTMHTRFATCGREFANTHPFIDKDTSLVHNGVIRNAFSTHYMTGLDVNKVSTCDSEAALQTYLAEGVNLDTEKSKRWLDLLTGSWAFGILSRDTENRRILDVIRGMSQLHYMEIDGIGKIFTTDDDDAKAVVKDMGLVFTKEPIRVAMDEMYRYDAVTGECLGSIDIKPKYVNSYGAKTTGSTHSGTTSASPSRQSSGNASSNKGRRVGENILALFEAVKDEPNAMDLMPDIFHEGSTPKNIKISHEKVKKHCNDITHPIEDRLDVFDLVFNTGFLAMFESLPVELREYVRDTDSMQGLKSARTLIKQIIDTKEVRA
jgi:hypothetical protein